MVHIYVSQKAYLLCIGIPFKNAPFCGGFQLVIGGTPSSHPSNWVNHPAIGVPEAARSTSGRI